MNGDREKIAREIAKTSESIRKKYRALKTGKMEEDVALERQFKPITDPLKQLVENTVESDAPKIEPLSLTFGDKHEEKIKEPKQGIKRARINMSINDSPIYSTPNRSKRRKQFSNIATVSTPIKVQPRQTIPSPSVEEIYETTPDSFVTSVRHELETSEGQKTFRDHFGPLAQKYIGAIMSVDKNKSMDYVYGVKFTSEGMMLGDKSFDVDKEDNIIIDGIKYTGTEGIYDLIFKKFPNHKKYTQDDLYKYQSILKTTNAHKRDNKVNNPIKTNKGYKYKYIIAPLFPDRKVGRGIDAPRTMTLSDNLIDYVHWNDPNELVDRLRLLDASRRAGNNAHDNEILSIIEELREAGIIIN